MCPNDFGHNISWLWIQCSTYKAPRLFSWPSWCWESRSGVDNSSALLTIGEGSAFSTNSCWSDLLTSVDVSPNRSCFAEASPRLLPAEHFAGCLQDGDNSMQRFTEQYCSSSSLVCIFWHFCLKSHTSWMNASHFLQISFVRQSLLFIAIPQV